MPQLQEWMRVLAAIQPTRQVQLAMRELVTQTTMVGPMI
jgi:hypothetical protein